MRSGDDINCRTVASWSRHVDGRFTAARVSAGVGAGWSRPSYGATLPAN